MTRPSVPAQPVLARFGPFELDEANARLLRDGRAVALAPTPFTLLCALVRHPGTLLSKHVLLDQVWGHQFVSDSVLKTAISDLRTVLDDDPRAPRYIETVSRRGYRFIAATVAISAASASSASVSPTVPPRQETFIGRAEAYTRLRSAWDSACGGRRAIVWVAGDPGIGKTTLIEHFVAGLGDVTCARGQCVEHFGASEPYLPVLEALAGLADDDAATGGRLCRERAAATAAAGVRACAGQRRRAVTRRGRAGHCRGGGQGAGPACREGPRDLRA
jgi:DNA-binding winged helix-turn-helix (wHTH) protein